MLGCRFQSFRDIVDYIEEYELYGYSSQAEALKGAHTKNEHSKYGYFIRNEYFVSEIFLELVRK